MKRGRIFRHAVLGLATLGLCIPRLAFAETTNQTPVVNDVVLQQGGTLVGHVVDHGNVPVEKVQVALYSNDKQLAANTTDKDGYFSFSGLNNGVYEVVTPEGSGVYRAWNENIAPPAAEPTALIVNGSDVVRGQQPIGSLRIPLLIGGLVATAIAVPVAIHNSKSSSSGN